MKKITLSLLFVLFFTTSIFSQKTVLVIGNGTTAPVAKYLGAEIRDTLAVKKLQEQGFTVLFINDDQTKSSATVENLALAQAALDQSNAVVVSSTVGGADVATITTTAITNGKPVLAWETAIYDEMKVMSGTLNVTPVASLATVNATVDAPFIGSLTSFTYSSSATAAALPSAKNRILAPGVVNIATTIAKAIDGTTDSIVAVAQYLKLGETNYLGTPATASAIAWNMFNNDNLPFITAEGWELFLRAVCVLADKPYVPTTGIKNVSSVNANVWFTNGNLNIEVSKNLTNSKIRVYNTEGRLVNSTLISGSGVISVPASNLKSGMYMVVGEGFKGKLIKE